MMFNFAPPVDPAPTLPMRKVETPAQVYHACVATALGGELVSYRRVRLMLTGAQMEELTRLNVESGIEALFQSEALKQHEAAAALTRLAVYRGLLAWDDDKGVKVAL